MTQYNCGDVVLVDVLFSDGSGIKKRPALIISSKEYNKKRQDVIIAAITSNVKRVLIGDTEVVKWKEAGLHFPSLVKGTIQTVKATRVTRKLGILNNNDLQEAKRNLNIALEICGDTRET
ncbi:MAG: type II toxin-antitoxin system PemK/MazF family toxin [Candidatus Aadella gelida]|nr:type II toxin-antitoxin system PemK/MazF family toxin [Candidatus Aadella gelida]